MSNTKTWRIYKYTNVINGKVYIGQTKNTIKRRAAGGSGYYKCTYFANAIRKYGWNSFTCELLEDGITTQEKSNELEKYYINLYNSNNMDFGYNIDAGGKSGTYLSIPIHKYSLEGEYICSYDSIDDAAQDLNIACSYIGKVSKTPGLLAGGFQWSRELVDRMPICMRDTQSFQVFQYDIFGNYMNGYDNAYEAGKQFGEWGSHRIIEHCKSQQGECFGFQWRYYKSNNIGTINNNSGVSKIVYQYDLDGNYITKYSSAAEAAKKYNVDRHAIAYCCRSLTRTSCGYLWSYILKNNYYEQKEGVCVNGFFTSSENS